MVANGGKVNEKMRWVKKTCAGVSHHEGNEPDPTDAQEEKKRIERIQQLLQQRAAEKKAAEEKWLTDGDEANKEKIRKILEDYKLCKELEREGEHL